MKVFELYSLHDDYDARDRHIGIYSTEEKALEALSIHAAKQQWQIIPKHEGGKDHFTYQEPYTKWDDELGDMVWDGENWIDAGEVFIWARELDVMPQKEG